MIGEDRAAEMEKLYVTERWTLVEIGRRFGLSRQRVSQILLNRGVKRFLPTDRIDGKVLVTMAKEVESIAELKARSHLTYRTIRTVLTREKYWSRFRRRVMKPVKVASE